MPLNQPLLMTEQQRAQFERVARERHGFRNFERRGQFYCLSELNTLAQGFMMNFDLHGRLALAGGQ